jgi:hypothetical protein
MISLEIKAVAPPSNPGVVSKEGAATLDFPQQLGTRRQHHVITQQASAERVGIHMVRVRRYEEGTSQPTLDAIRELATPPAVSEDLLLFGKDGVVRMMTIGCSSRPFRNLTPVKA